MNKYAVINYWSEEDEAFVAEAPELPGCAAHGPTQEAALAGAQEVIRLWVDTAKEFGDPVPEPKGRPLERFVRPLRGQAQIRRRANPARR